MKREHVLHGAVLQLLVSQFSDLASEFSDLVSEFQNLVSEFQNLVSEWQELLSEYQEHIEQCSYTRGGPAEKAATSKIKLFFNKIITLN